MRPPSIPSLALVLGAACTGPNGTVLVPATSSASQVAGSDNKSLPADASRVANRLATSPRHGEWTMIRTPEGDSIKAWVVYPERRTRAPVILVIHEVYGLSAWVRGVAD